MQMLHIPDQKIETGVLGQTMSKRISIGSRCGRLTQKARYQVSASFCARSDSGSVAIIRNSGPTSVPGNTHPRTAFFQVAPGKNLLSVYPVIGRRGRPPEKFVAIGGNHKVIA